MPKITDLTEATTFAGTDYLPIVQGGSTKRISAATFITDTVDHALAVVAAQPEVRWRAIDTDDYSATPSSTSRISTTSDQFQPGMPVRYKYGGVFYYGVVGTVSVGVYADVRGPAMNIASPLQEVAIGGPERVAQYDIFLSGAYAAALGLRVASVMQTYCRWMMGPARLVSFAAAHVLPDSGTEPKINVTIGGDEVSLQDSGNGIQLSATAATFVEASLASIDPTRYAIEYGELIDIEVKNRGTSFNASDLTVSIVFVLV